MTATRRATSEARSPLDDPDLHAIAVGVSKDPNAKVTILFFRNQDTTPTCCCKIPTTDRAEQAVRAEAHALRALHGEELGGVASTVPRVVSEPVVGGRRALVLTGLPGTPMATDYNAWRHTGDRRAVRSDFVAVRRWLLQLWAATERGSRPLDVVKEILPLLEEQFSEHPLQNAVMNRLTRLGKRLRGVESPATAAHGDLWFGNLLCEGGRVTGALDWEFAALWGQPVRDLLRFVLSYALYLDRHTRPGRLVRGHRWVRAGRFGVGVEHAVHGRGWFPDLAREFLQQGLRDLGIPSHLWRELALVGVAEAAATADDPGFAASNLELFDRLGRVVSVL